MAEDSADSRLFFVIGIGLLAALAIWIGIELTGGSLIAQHVDPRGVGARGPLDPAAPTAEMDDLLEQVHEEVNTGYTRAHRYGFCGRLCDWISFAFTSLVTLFAGYLGRPLAEGQDTAELTAALAKSRLRSSKTWLRVIGVAAALASITISLSSRLETSSARSLKQAEVLLHATNQARLQFMNAETAEQGWTILTDLKAEFEKRR